MSAEEQSTRSAKIRYRPCGARLFDARPANGPATSGYVPPMTRFGYPLMTEQSDPRELDGGAGAIVQTGDDGPDRFLAEAAGKLRATAG